MFKPGAQQFTTVIRLQHRKSVTVNGAPKPTYEDFTPATHFCEYKPFFGSEGIQAGMLGITAGGTITMWYTPGVRIGDRVLLDDDTDQAYEITSVEDVENRHLYLVLKVKRAVSA
jgi:SPP1 family predicted phage head-tail adaptor